MRVIAGSKRRLPLKTMKGNDTRPTTDRIKETLFNMLQTELSNGYFLDLFAGSGQIGIEALSRGAKYAVFVDHSKQAQECIQENLAFTKLKEESLVLKTDVMAALYFLEGKYKFDFIFMDPPYEARFEKQVLSYLSSSSLLKENTLIIVEALQKTDFSYLQETGFSIVREKKYKTNMHLFLTRGQS